MKVPSSPVGQVRPSSQGLDYFRPANTGAIVEAWSGVARGLVGIGEAFKQREEKDARFKAAQEFNEFQIKVNEDFVTEQRDSPIGDANVMDRMQTHYQNREDEFVSKLAPDLQEEFRTRAGEVKQSVFAKSLEFQYKQQDAYYRVGIESTYEAAKNGLALSKDPAQLETYRAQVFEKIDGSDLTDIEKVKLKHDTSIGLLGIAYQEDIKKRVAAEQVTPKTSVDHARNQQLEFTVHELKGSEKAAGDQLLRATTLAEAVDAGLAYERPSIPARNNRLRNAAAVLAGKAPKGALAARAYYESQGYTPVQASGFVGSLMQESGADLTPSAANPNDPGTSIGIAQWNRERKAAMLAFTGQPGAGDTASKSSGAFLSLDNDPTYADLPHETRVALQSDAMASYNREAGAQAKADKEAHDAFMNTTLLRVHDDPTFGKTDIDSLYSDGKITDYEDLMKLEKAVETRDAEGNTLLDAQRKMASGGIWNPMDEKDKKMLNSLVGEEGLASLAKGDKAYFSEKLLPDILRAQDMATSAAGLLAGMSRDRNQSLALYALDAMAQIRDQAPAAFDQRFDPVTTANVVVFDKYKGLYPDDQLMSIIRGGVTQEERQRNAALRTEGERIIADPKEAPPLSKVLDAFDVGLLYSNPDVYAAQGARMVALNEFNTLFVNEYARWGDVAAATDAAIAVMKQNWGVTQIGGQNLLMKHPPEVVGLPAFDGSYAWADEQIRTAFQIKPEDRYQLMSDDITQSERDNYRTGKGGFPTYGVILWKDGVPEVDHTKRMNFVQPPELIKIEEDMGDLRLKQGEQQNFFKNVYQPELLRSQQSGKPIDPDIEEAYRQLAKESLDQEGSILVRKSKPAPPIPVERTGRFGTYTPGMIIPKGNVQKRTDILNKRAKR